MRSALESRCAVRVSSPHSELAPEVEHFYSQVVDESTRLNVSVGGGLELLRTQKSCAGSCPLPPPEHLLRLSDRPARGGLTEQWRRKHAGKRERWRYESEMLRPESLRAILPVESASL